MATAKILSESHFTLKLTLSVEEAQILKTMVQNPLRKDESLTESALRKVIFEELATYV